MGLELVAGLVLAEDSNRVYKFRYRVSRFGNTVGL